jgi:hypothetical protein
MKRSKLVVFLTWTTFCLVLLFLLSYNHLSKSPYDRAQVAHHAEPPLAETALRQYDKALLNDGPVRRTDALLQKATILDHGILQGPEPVQPDRVSAIGFYRQVAVLGSPREQALARDRLIELDDRVFENPPPRRQYVVAVVAPREAAPSGGDDGPRSDSQNVHDSSVVKSVKSALDRLSPSPMSMETTLVEVRKSLASDEDALKGLDLMEKNTHPLTALKMTEVEVLRKIWGRIQTEQDETKRQDMSNMLKQRLQECGKDASCASGRVARVVDSLSTFDDVVNLRPLWAMRQEMLAKASVLRNHVDETSGASLSDVLRKEFTKDYVDTGLMTANVLEAELVSWGQDL